MATFNYDDYAAQQANRRAAKENSNSGDRPEVHFIGEYLKNSGDVVIVRFPYASMSDIQFETTHSVTFPDKKYPTRVRCSGKDCPLCAEKVKVDTRFFVKALVYDIDPKTNAVNVVSAIWDRPSAFADIDLKEKMQECAENEYGPLCDNLVKIKRNGTGTDTRYTMSIIRNEKVYPTSVFVKDFTELDKVNPSVILSKPLDLYLKALNPTANAATEATVEAAEPVEAVADEEVVDDTDAVEEAPVYTAYTRPETPAPAARTAVRNPVPGTTTESAKPQRYKF